MALTVIGSSVHAEDIDVGRIFVETMVEGVREGLCGDKDAVHWMMRSNDETIRKQGYACFGIEQANKFNNRLKGHSVNAEEVCSGSDTKSICKVDRSRGNSEPVLKVDHKTQCRNESGKIKCKIWFPETEINGDLIPAGFRDVNIGEK